MKKLQWTGCLVMLLMAVGVCQAQVVDEEIKYQQLEKHTVKLFQSFEGTPFQFGHICTAVVIEQQEEMSMLFTAGHCVDEDDKSYMVLADRPYYVVKKYVSRYVDIAVLFAVGNLGNKEEVLLSRKRLSLGDRLYNFSYPSNIRFKKNGQFIDEDWYAGSVDFVVIQGCSGSGVFNEDNELEGIVISYNKYEPISYYIPIAEFYRFFHQLEVDGELVPMNI